MHGSDASQFQPGLTASSPVEVWIADLFQARRLVVNSSVDLSGIKLLRYWLVGGFCVLFENLGWGGGATAGTGGGEVQTFVVASLLSVGCAVSDLGQAGGPVSCAAFRSCSCGLVLQDPAQSKPNPCRNQEVQGLMNITTPQVGASTP